MRAVGLSLAIAVAGCDSSRPATDVDPAVGGPVEVVEVRSPYAGKLIGCDEADAELVLDLFVTVRDEFEEWPFSIPLRTASDTDWNAHGGGYFCAAGPTGGFSGSVRVVPSDGPSARHEVAVQVSLQFSSPRGRGQVDERITATVGEAGAARIGEV